MSVRDFILAVLLLAPPSFALAQEPLMFGGKAFAGKWTGTWLSDGRSRAIGDMQMDLYVDDADRISGQVTFTTAATPPCSQERQRF